MADFKVPFGSQSGRRPPNADEKINGFPCGPADQQLFNGLFWRIESELGAILNDAGIVPSDDNLAQVLEAIQLLIKRGVGTTKIPAQNLNKLPWISVISNTVRTPPEKPATGDTYLVADNALGDWTGYDGYIAEWSGTGWLLKQADDGHGVGLPDGTQLLRVGGKYWTQTAMDVQSGKWVFATTSGTDNNYMAYMTPAPLGVWAGAHVRLKLDRRNTGPATLNLNGLGAKPIVYTDGAELVGGDFDTGYVVDLTFDGKSWQIAPTQAYYDTRYSKFPEPPATTFYVVGPTGSDKNSGLKPTPEEGFATIQGAVNALSKYMTAATITILVSPGTYDSVNVPVSHVARWAFIGNPDNPDAVKIQAKNESGKSTCINVASGIVTISGFSLFGVTGCVSTVGVGGAVSVYDSNINVSPGWRGFEAWDGTFFVGGKINVKGTAGSVFFAAKRATMDIGWIGPYDRSPAEITFDNVTCSGAVFDVQTGAILSIDMAVVTFNGVPTGAKYSVSGNGVLAAYGGADRIPGSKDGWIATGGRVI